MDAKIRPLGSLKTRVTLFTLVIFIASLWSLAFYASRMLREDMQQQLSEQQLSVVSFIARAIDDHLDDRIQALEVLAGTLGAQTFGDVSGVQHILDSQSVLQTWWSAASPPTNLGPLPWPVAAMPPCRSPCSTNNPNPMRGLRASHTSRT